jgi:HK97 family phage major capsid protein
MDDETATLDPVAELATTRSELLTRAARLHEMLDQPVEKRSASWGAELKTARDEVMGLDARFTALERNQPEIEIEVRGQGPKAAHRIIGRPSGETRSLGQQLVESDDYQEYIARGRDKTDHGKVVRSAPSGSLMSTEVRTLITGVQTDTGFTSAGAFAPIMPYVIFPQAVRRDRLVVRDLLPTTTTTYEVVHYVAETYVSGTDADMVAEGALKPEVVMIWSRVDTLVQKIAAWVPATLESLADVGALRGAIDNRLQYKVLRREESELLNGSGTPPHLLGLLNATNIQTQAHDTNSFTSFADGRADIENHDGDATGSIWHPTDYWAAMAASTSTLTGASPFQGPPDTIWGLPAVRTPRMTLGHVLLGDFTMGAEIFDREDMTVRIGDQHSDYFIRNQVAILMEKRETLAIYRGDLFVNVTL